MRKCEKKELVNLIRHLATYFDAYNCVGKREVPPEFLKSSLMEYSQKPESTARSYIKKIKEDDPGLFTYDPIEDLIYLDPERTEEFIYNLEILLRIDQVTHKCMRSKLERTNIQKGGNSNV